MPQPTIPGLPKQVVAGALHIELGEPMEIGEGRTREQRKVDTIYHLLSVNPQLQAAYFMCQSDDERRQLIRSLDAPVYFLYAFHGGVEEMRRALSQNLDEIKNKHDKVIFVAEDSVTDHSTFMEASNMVQPLPPIQKVDALRRMFNLLKGRSREAATRPIVGDTNIPSKAAVVNEQVRGRGMRMELESISFETWKTTFENEFVALDAFDAVIRTGDVDGYLESMRKYASERLRLNKVRDSEFADWLKKLRAVNPGAALVTLRGLGHMGMEKGLYDEGIDVYPILEEGVARTAPLNDLLLARSEGREVSPEEEERLLLLALPYRTLEYPLLENTKDNDIAARVAREMTDTLDAPQLRGLISEVSTRYQNLIKLFTSMGEEDAGKTIDPQSWVSGSVGTSIIVSWLRQNGGFTPERWAEFDRYFGEKPPESL